MRRILFFAAVWICAAMLAYCVVGTVVVAVRQNYFELSHQSGTRRYVMGFGLTDFYFCRYDFPPDTAKIAGEVGIVSNGEVLERRDFVFGETDHDYRNAYYSSDPAARYDPSTDGWDKLVQFRHAIQFDKKMVVFRTTRVAPVLAILPAIAAAIRIRRWAQRRRRHRLTHCRNCGYDVRASPERCPECGQVRG